MQTKFYFLLRSLKGLVVIYILLSEQMVTFCENIKLTESLCVVPGTYKHAHICILTSKHQVYLQLDLWRGTAEKPIVCNIPKLTALYGNWQFITVSTRVPTGSWVTQIQPNPDFCFSKIRFNITLFTFIHQKWVILLMSTLTIIFKKFVVVPKRAIYFEHCHGTDNVQLWQQSDPIAQHGNQSKLVTTTRQRFETASHKHKYSRNPLIRTLIIRINDYPDGLGPSGKFVENSTELIALKLPVIGSSTVQCYDF